MSVHVIYYQDGGKRMRPVLTREEYLALRGSARQQRILAAVRGGDEAAKRRLVQMNYSCLPAEDGALRGATQPSNTVGMDVDHIKAEEMAAVRERILANKDALELLMLERSARGQGFHLVFRRRRELTQEENLRRASDLLGVEFDHGAKDITRVFFTTTASEEELLFLDDEIFGLTPDPSPKGEGSSHLQEQTSQAESPEGAVRAQAGMERSEIPVTSANQSKQNPKGVTESSDSPSGFSPSFRGIPYTSIIAEYWRRTGGEPAEGERNKRLHQLAANLRAICDNSEEWLLKLMPRYGLAEQEMRAIVHSACKEPTKGSRMMDAIVTELAPLSSPEGDTDAASIDDAGTAEDNELSTINYQLSTHRKLPQGIRDSIEAVGPAMAMPTLTAICPAIGALATGVTLDVHGQRKGLNLIAYIAGDFASGKGGIDPVIDAWMAEVKALDTMYQTQEEEYRARKRAAKNKKEQPEEPRLPVRCLTLNNTVANLAERLANTEGRHAFSFTPEADTVAQKWRSAMSDFSVMLRQSYDGTAYEREARSADAVNVHIRRLLWNVTLCGTPDALYRVVSNYTDGFQSRIAVARTPDNTFAPLEEHPHVMTDRQRERIAQVAHLLPLMCGEVVLPKLEARGRAWLERIRMEAMKNDDRVRARQRFRVCVTAQRMTCCVMLCHVAEQLIKKHGMNGAETRLKQHPTLWQTMLLKAQTPQLLEAYDIIADALLDSALHFFRDRIEAAFASRDYAGAADRQRIGRNDSIYERLDVEFGIDAAFQHSVSVKGASVSRNAVRQMLKNWKRQGLVVQTEAGRYRKVCA